MGYLIWLLLMGIFGAGGKREQFISELRRQLGKPYVYGAEGPDAYDCSGLVQSAYAKAGITTPRCVTEQAQQAPRFVSIYDKAGAQRYARPGDQIGLGRAPDGRYEHVITYIGNGRIIAASAGSAMKVIETGWDYYGEGLDWRSVYGYL